MEPWYILVSVGLLGVAVTLGTLLFKGGKWVGTITTTIDNLGDHLKDVREDLRQLRLDVGKLLGKPVPVDAGSPLRLTDYGEDMAEKLDAAMWAKMEANQLRRQGQDTGAERYEIEEFRFEHVRKKYPTVRDLEPSLRAAIYQHSLDKDHVYDVLAVVLRDELIRRSEVA